MSQVNLYYFTGTGNSLYVAKSIRNAIGNMKVDLIDIATLVSIKEIRSDAEVNGIIYPTYGGDAPRVVKKFAERFNTMNKGYLFLFNTSAGFSGSSINRVASILMKKSIDVNNAFKIRQPDNSGLKKVTQEERAEVNDAAETSLAASISEILAMKSLDKKSKLKMKPLHHFSSKFAEPLLKKYWVFNVINVEEQCNGCGICKKVCPMSNIDLVHGKPKFNDKCEMCLACVNACPKEALSYKKLNRFNGYQYRHPKIELNELFR